VKILLDECIDQGLAPMISGHDVKTVESVGWASLKNGQILSLAAHSKPASGRSLFCAVIRMD